MTQRLARLAVTALLAVVMVGCGDGSPDAGAHRTTGPAPSPPSPTPWVALPGLEDCGPQPPEVADADHRQMTLRSRGRTLPAVVTGRGRTVVVLVHQTDGGGLCGWLPFAARIAAVPGQATIAFDLCGYGHAECRSGNGTAARQVEQVRLAVDVAERRLHAGRIVVVGASMGGSLAVLTAARDPRVDAAVDLSGPDEWRDVRVSRVAAGVRVPLLVAMADDEGADSVAAARATAGAAADGSAFVGAAAGHGYALLEDGSGAPTPIAERVLAWIAAR